MKKKFKITEQQAQKILKLNGATQQAPNPCNQFIAQVVPSQGGGGDIDCCKMLNGDMVGPYGNTAGSQMLQTHCDVAWSMAVMGGTFNDGNQLGGSLAWADCCKNDTTTGEDKWLCEGGACYNHPSGTFNTESECEDKCGRSNTGEDKWLCEGGECYNHPSGTYTSLPDCEKNCGRSNTGNGGGCSDDVCPNPNHVKTPFNPDGSGCKCECTNRYQQCEAPWVWDENKCTCAEPTDFAPDLQSKKLAPPETKDQKELREEMTRIKELLK
jgi:hypothetical protein|tara:strand:- start:353 stop:1159 length:807 start_codon:yes stop_codon:yes gene_type:complete